MRRFPATATLLLLIGCGFFLQTLLALLHQLAGGSLLGAFVLSWVLPDVAILQTLGGIGAGTLEPAGWWRLVAATFLHAGIVHLLLNGWALLQLGTAFELLYGARRLVTVYAISGLVASIASAAWLEAQVSVGASGAIFGLMGALMVLLGSGPKRAWQARLRNQLLAWAAATLVMGLMSEGIDNAAHIAGLIAGLASALVLLQMPSSRERSLQR